MISIIVCSRNKILPKSFIENINSTIGVNYEIITIDNSENKYSIFSAYNQGFSLSKNPYLCFLHEDVKFHSMDWGEKLIAHLNIANVGIVGLAGGDVMTRVPASWSAYSPSVNILQSDKSGRKATEVIKSPLGFSQSRKSAVLLDGVFLGMKRELMEILKFDESIGGFHGYDFDISLQAYDLGRENFVIYDILLEHFSRGVPDMNYYRNLIVVFKKWEQKLPILGKSVLHFQSADVKKMEEKMFHILIKRMARKGFSTHEIINEAAYYNQRIGTLKAMKMVKHIKSKLFFVRIMSCPKFLFR